MKWPFEEQSEYRKEYARFLNEFLESYFELTWRLQVVHGATVALKNHLINAYTALDLDLNKIRNIILNQLYSHDVSLDELNLKFNISKLENDSSCLPLLLAEVLAGTFATNTNEDLWNLISEVIDNNPPAFRVLVKTIKSCTEDSDVFLNDVKALATSFINTFSQAPSFMFPSRDKASFEELHRQWQKKPNLSEILSSLNKNQYFLPIKSDKYILDLIFEISPITACELMEEYKNPYQVEMILNEGFISPSHKYENWKILMQNALSAFEENGNWNGRILAPLLLSVAIDAVVSGNNLTDRGEANNFANLSELVFSMSDVISVRGDYDAISFRWCGWLLRSIIIDGVVDIEKCKPRHKISWLIVQYFVDNKPPVNWKELNPSDIKNEDILCFEAAKILAFEKLGLKYKIENLIFGILPNEPEEFLEGDKGKRMRSLVSLFTGWQKRPDALGVRIIASNLVSDDVVSLYEQLWRKTIILREMVEHNFSTKEKTHEIDVARDASAILRFINFIGINMLDTLYFNDTETNLNSCLETLQKLFELVNNSLHELMAIESIGMHEIEEISNHLCLRRIFFDSEFSTSRNNQVSIPLNVAPTLGDILFYRCRIDREFFACINLLIINGATESYIANSLASVGVNFNSMVKQAVELNKISKDRKIDLSFLQTQQDN